MLAIPVGSSGSEEVEVFPACRGILDNDRFVFLKDELLGISGDDRSVLDVSDPERPINFVPQDRKRQRSGEEALEDDDEELIPDRPPEGFRPGYEPELGYDPERGFQGTDSEYAPSDVDPAGFGDMEIDEDGDARMEEDIEAKLIDLLVNESLLGIYRGPDLRSVGSGKSRSFEVPFCGSVIRCIVPDSAISETTGEKLDPELLLAAMKLELQELENFHCGRDGRLHASTRAYARVRSSTHEYARVRTSTLEYARVRTSTHEYARVRTSTLEYARVRSSTHEYARVRSSTLEYARVRSSTHEYARVRSSTHEYVRVRTSTFEYARVRSSTHEYARVRSSTHEYARVRTSTLEYARVRSSTHEYARVRTSTHEYARVRTSTLEYARVRSRTIYRTKYVLYVGSYIFSIQYSNIWHTLYIAYTTVHNIYIYICMCACM